MSTPEKQQTPVTWTGVVALTILCLTVVAVVWLLTR